MGRPERKKCLSYLDGINYCKVGKENKREENIKMER